MITIKSKRLSKASKIFMAAAMIATVPLGMAGMNTSTADAASGTGGGDAGSGSTGYWRGLYGAAGSQQAWGQFVNRTRGQFANVGKWVQRAGQMHGNPNLLTQCQNSRYIWYYGDNVNPNIWYNMGSYTNNAPWAEHRPSQSEMNEFLKWGGANWRKGNTVLVCSGSYEQLEKDCGSREEKRKVEQGKPIKLEGIYAKASGVAPVATQEFPKWDNDRRKAWQETHFAQNAKDTTGNYKKWYDQNKSKIDKMGKVTGKEFDKLKKEVNDSYNKLGKNNNFASPTVNFDKKNSEGFTDGAVFTASDKEKKSTVQLGTQKRIDKRTIKCKMKMQPNGTWKKQESAQPWRNAAGGYEKGAASNAKVASFVPTKFSQILNANCNKKEVDNVFANAGLGNDRKGKQVDKNLPDSIKTNTYNSSNKVPFGNAKHANRVLKTTAHDPLYYEGKECPVDPNIKPPEYTNVIDCVSDGAKVPAGDYPNNIANKPKDGYEFASNDKFGAQYAADGANYVTDSATLFRDNINNTLRLDQWIPNVRVGAGLDGSSISIKPIGTTMALDGKGTPNKKGQFSIDAGGMKFAAPVNNKAVSTNKSVNMLETKGLWASDKDKPHQLRAVWKYNVTGIPYLRVETISQNGNTVAVKTRVDHKDKIVHCNMGLNKTFGAPKYEGPKTSVNPNYDNYDQVGGDSFKIDFVRSGSAAK